MDKIVRQVHLAVEMINRGVRHMIDKEIKEATSELTASLAVVKGAVADFGATADEFSPSQGIELAFAGIDTNAQLQLVDGQTPTFVFFHPISVSIAAGADTATICEGIPKIPFAIVYNLALAYHMAALQSKKPNKKRLGKALTFYSFATNMSQDLGIMESLAISNNISQVYQTMGLAGECEAEEAGEHLLQWIMYVITNKMAAEVPSFEYFLANVIPRILNRQPPAEAA